MKLAFCLFKYFPYGGMQRNFAAIVNACLSAGHEVEIFCGSWQGEAIAGAELKLYKPSGVSNHSRNRSLALQFNDAIAEDSYDRVVGFNKMPGLDWYYAADACFASKAYEQKGPLYRSLPRCKNYLAYENAVFASNSQTKILMVSEKQKPNFMKYYATQEQRFYYLPPGISRDRMAPPDLAERREGFRKQLGFAADENIVLLVGSGFKTKGLDRGITSLASLPRQVLQKTYLLVVGQDNDKPFKKMAKRYNLESQVKFYSGRDDVPSFLFAADLLIHPAYNENTGNVLVEAIIAGLPVLTNDVCGYAHYVLEADAGMVLPSPFSQQQLDQSLLSMLQQKNTQPWSRNGIEFGKHGDLYSRAQRAMEYITGGEA